MTGCSGLGLDFTDERTIAITRPPFQIVVSGDLTNADKEVMIDVIKILDATEFKDYDFNEKISVVVSGSEIITERIITHEETAD